MVEVREDEPVAEAKLAAELRAATVDVDTIGPTLASVVAVTVRPALVVLLLVSNEDVAATIEVNEWTRPAKDCECDPARAAAAAAAVRARTSAEVEAVALLVEPG